MYRTGYVVPWGHYGHMRACTVLSYMGYMGISELMQTRLGIINSRIHAIAGLVTGYIPSYWPLEQHMPVQAMI